jgi:hypothetical protein
MTFTYAGKIVDGIVVDAIVADPGWASANLDGEWHDSTTTIWIGGSWDANHGFRPEQPSPDCDWIDGEWVCPEPEPEPPVE